MAEVFAAFEVSVDEKVLVAMSERARVFLLREIDRAMAAGAPIMCVISDATLRTTWWGRAPQEMVHSLQAIARGDIDAYIDLLERRNLDEFIDEVESRRG